MPKYVNDLFDMSKMKTFIWESVDNVSTCLIVDSNNCEKLYQKHWLTVYTISTEN